MEELIRKLGDRDRVWREDVSVVSWVGSMMELLLGS